MTEAATLNHPQPDSGQSSYGRPISIEERSNRFLIHPLSDIVVKAGIALNISPNAVSVAGLACGVLAAFLYFQMPELSYVIGGFVAMLCWHILDGADGRLARATGKTSAFGRIIDGMCDHVVFASVYISFAFYLTSHGTPFTIWWLVVGAGLSHAVQAAGYEERRQKFQRRLKGQARDGVQEKLLMIEGKRSWLASLYDSAQKIVAGHDQGLDRKLAEMRKNDGGDQQAEALIFKTAPMVRAWALLNANNRTGLIFICALAGHPAWYFAIELFAFNFILGGLLLAERRLEKTLAGDVSGDQLALKNS